MRKYRENATIVATNEQSTSDEKLPTFPEIIKLINDVTIEQFQLWINRNSPLNARETKNASLYFERLREETTDLYAIMLRMDEPPILMLCEDKSFPRTLLEPADSILKETPSNTEHDNFRWFFDVIRIAVLVEEKIKMSRVPTFH